MVNNEIIHYMNMFETKVTVQTQKPCPQMCTLAGISNDAVWNEEFARSQHKRLLFYVQQQAWLFEHYFQE